MRQAKFFVPTEYTGRKSARAFDERGEVDRMVPVIVASAGGIRLVLGSHDYFDLDVPVIQVERRPNGWEIFLFAKSGEDASACAYFIDDGRCLMTPDDESPVLAATLEEWDAVREIVNEKSLGGRSCKR